MPYYTHTHTSHARVPHCPASSHAGHTSKYNRERRTRTAGPAPRAPPFSYARPDAHPEETLSLSGSGTRIALLGQRAARRAHESTEGVLAATSTRRRAQMRNQKRQLKHGQSTKRMSITSLPALIGRSHESAR